MSRQMPEMYLRGSLINVTMKNLTSKQMQFVEDQIIELENFEPLNKCKETICNTLRKTIKGDYAEEKIYAMQEFRIAMMRAIVHAKYHKPNKDVFMDPIQKRKFFSQFGYNYMRQILNENKIPYSKIDRKFSGKPTEIALKQIMHELKICDLTLVNDSEDSFLVTGDIWKINLKTAIKVGKMKSKYEKYGVEIKADTEKISIKKLRCHPNIELKLTEKIRIRSSNINVDDENDRNNTNAEIEYQMSKKKSNDDDYSTVNNLKSIVSKEVKELIALIVDAPKDFINKYGTDEPNKKQISEYLGISLNEVKVRMEKLRKYYILSKSL